MSSRHHIDDFMRGRIIGKIEEGRKITDVAREFDIAHSVVSRLWKSFKTTGMCSRRHGGGRVRSTTPAEDRYIVLSAKKNRRTTAQQGADQFLASSGKQISRKTVDRRLRGGGLYTRRPVVCVPLTRQHRTARLQWCREHHNWTEQDWACVLFSDEKNIQEKDRYPTCSIMVWAGIMINGRTRLHVVANGTMTGQRYIDEVLLPHVRLFRGAVGDKFVFMDDNATCHRTLTVQDCLDSEGIQRLVWPARSPDLNPIENVWDALGRQVAGRNYPPTNKNTLVRALTEEWDKLPQQLLDNVVQSMVRRVEYCITLHGGHIPTFEFSTPTITVADPDLLRDIFVKDFHIFPYRRDIVSGDPLSDKSVASLSGEDWKRIRTIITPAFTSKRMRQMGSIINECSETVLEVCEKHCERDEPVDCKRVFGAFTMDVIASSAFGTKIDSHNDPDNEFVSRVRKAFLNFTFLRMMLF
ncbi:cytochrome P450 3A5, partial [Trichonephila clavipes]